jgi:hypothetical protein
MLKMVDGTGIIGVDMVCPLGVSTPQPPNYDNIEMEGVGSLVLANSLKAPLERVELLGNSVQGENPAPDNPQEIKSAGRFDEASGKYLLDIKVTGKNLFDINNYVGSIEKISESEFHTEAKWGTLIGDINLKAGGKYNISYTFEIDSITNSDCGVRIKCTKSDGTVSYIFDLPKMTGYVCNYTKSAVVPVGTVKCEILLYTDVKLKIGGTFKKLMIAEDSENVALNIYEPYTEQSMQIALDEPLGGIGEYKDVLTKDGVVRKIKRTVFDGSEDEKWALSNDPKNITTNRFCIGMKTINTYYKMLTMCNKMAWKNANQVDVVGQSTHGVNFYITLPKDLAPDLQTFRTWLSQNSLTVDYVLAEPVTELLPESVQDQLSALHSENGVTHVFVDSGEVECGIKLTYRKEK